MEQTGMYVEDLYTIPEVRTITPSHLVRAGTTLAYDANFGMTRVPTQSTSCSRDSVVSPSVEIQEKRCITWKLTKPSSSVMSIWMR